LGGGRVPELVVVVAGLRMVDPPTGTAGVGTGKAAL